MGGHYSGPSGSPRAWRSSAALAPASARSGSSVTIAFNPDFLMAPLRNLDNDEVYLELIDEMSPGVLKINAPFLYVLMPMRVSQ